MRGFQSEGEQKLSAGIKSYEEGDYKISSRLLQEALKKGLVSKSDKIQAHKYLAFIDCVTGQERRCSEEFKSILALDTNFELTGAEAGHPIWGPVFRNLKGKKAK